MCINIDALKDPKVYKKYILKRGVPAMFGKEKKTEEVKVNDTYSYDVEVQEVRRTKNDKIVMLDLKVNGVWIKSCLLKEVTVKEDGEKHKKGDIVYILSFPSEKSGDKYYNRAWFPVSNETLEDICRQVQEML